MILTCEGEVFFATHSIEGYLGFHQVSYVYLNNSSREHSTKQFLNTRYN